MFFVVDKSGFVRHTMCGFRDGSIESEIEPAVNVIR
jgi:hypothetical protein